jgi:hypothetical protein
MVTTSAATSLNPRLALALASNRGVADLAHTPGMSLRSAPCASNRWHRAHPRIYACHDTRRIGDDSTQVRPADLNDVLAVLRRY